MSEQYDKAAAAWAAVATAEAAALWATEAVKAAVGGTKNA